MSAFDFEGFKSFLNKDFSSDITYKKINYNNYVINTISTNIYSLIKILKNNSNYKFEQLIDITAVDYPANNQRFNIVYILLSLSLNIRVIVKTSIQENQNIDSISDIYKAANWHERECYDLFGIKFLNHPDLRRIMTDYNFEGHPLRKDFPLTGHSEVSYDEEEKRIVYKPVNLTQEFRNFDYSSPWEGLPNELIGDEKTENNK